MATNGKPAEGCACFYGAEVVEDDDIAGPQHGHRDIPDAGLENLGVGRASPMVMQAMVPSSRTGTIIVVVRQCPPGAWRTRRRPLGEQPQQRFEMFGAGAPSDTELIAIMLHPGIRGHSVLGLASQLIVQAGSIAGLASWQPEDFRRLKGIGRAKSKRSESAPAHQLYTGALFQKSLAYARRIKADESWV